MAYPNLPPAPPPPEPVGSTNVAFNTTMRMDLSYITTHIGILRMLIAVLNAIAAICISCSAFSNHGQGVFFTVVSLFGLLYTLIVFTAYTFHAVEKYHDWKWLKMEVAVAVAFVFLNLITSTIVVAFGSAAYSTAGVIIMHVPGNLVLNLVYQGKISRQEPDGFFGYLCMVSYGAEAWLRGDAWRRGEPAQGHVVLFKHAPAPAPPRPEGA